MSAGPLLPEIDEDSAPFWEGCLRGELRVQACARCGRRRMPPRPLCPWCRSFDARWEPMSGRGSVWSFVVAHPPLLPAYAEQAPYNVVVVALDDDPSIRLVGNLVARADGPIGEIDPATIRIGEPVEVVFERVAEDVALPRWVRRVG
ncbi:MAG: OB-fold domain-containing protein [Acidimicrobiales bacterium]